MVQIHTGDSVGGIGVNAVVTTNKPLVLIGEDDPADRNLIERALRSADVSVKLLADGEEMLQYLSATSVCDAEQKQPDLIIVDLNMPRLNGEMVMKHIRLTKGINRIPVVVFSSSNSRADISACYDAGCSSYVVKPTDLEPFMSALQMITGYWLGLVERPHAGDRS